MGLASIKLHAMTLNHALERTQLERGDCSRCAPWAFRFMLSVDSRAVRNTLLYLGLATLVVQASGADIPSDWKRLLGTPLVDDWQPVFGAALTYPARPAETWAQKIIELQR